MWPRSFWEKLYEPSIRQHGRAWRRAGTALIRTIIALPICIAICWLWAVVRLDLKALSKASATGKSVVFLIDEQDELGGGALSDPKLWPWLESQRARLGGCS